MYFRQHGCSLKGLELGRLKIWVPTVTTLWCLRLWKKTRLDAAQICQIDQVTCFE